MGPCIPSAIECGICPNKSGGSLTRSRFSARPSDGWVPAPISPESIHRCHICRFPLVPKVTISDGRQGWIALRYRVRLLRSIQGGRRGFVPEELLEIELPGSLEEPVRAAEPTSIERVTDPLADRRVRLELRRQIALLEKRLGELFASAFPRAGIEWGVPAVGGPRILGVAELERVRDGLAVRLG